MSGKMRSNNFFVIFYLIRKYAWPFWRHIVLLVFLTLLANVFTTIQPVIVAGAVETALTVTGASGFAAAKADVARVNLFDLNQMGRQVKEAVHRFTGKGPDDIWQLLIAMSVLFILISLLSVITNFASMVTARWIRTQSARLIRLDVLRHLLSLNLGFFHRQKSGELISRVTQDATTTGVGLGPLVRNLIYQTALIVIYSLYLFNTNIWLTASAFVLILLQFAVTQLLKKPVRVTVTQELNKLADFTTTLEEMLTGIRVIKSFGSEEQEIGALTRDIDWVQRSEFKKGVVFDLEPFVREFLDSLAIIGIFLIASFQLMIGNLTVQGFLLFIFVGRLLIDPINKFFANFTSIQVLRASYARLDEILSERPQVEDGRLTVRDFKRRLEMKNVTFAYGRDKEPVLKNIDLTIDRMAVVALVGPSGAGKSTLTDLILRFYDPQEGAITIDGIDLKSVRGPEYRRIFGVVPQESLLFNDTIFENIRYGRTDIKEEGVIAAAKTANAHDFISEFPQGYQTLVGDRGVRLSGGQRQRIAIARAVVSQPRILIFDEATSSLDTQAELEVQKAVDRVLVQATAIVIAHRLSTILHADKIVVMNKGRIEAVGRHGELLAICPTYRRLYELQFGAEKRLN